MGSGSDTPAAASAPTLGVDIGGVLALIDADVPERSFFGSRPMETIVAPGAVASLARLSAALDGRVHLISKAGPRVEAISREWLAHRRILEDSGIDPDHVHFVRERPEKAGLCSRYGVTHFVDDRIDVLSSMRRVRTRILFLPGRDGSRNVQVPRWAVPAADWSDVEKAAIGSP